VGERLRRCVSQFVAIQGFDYDTFRNILIKFTFWASGDLEHLYPNPELVAYLALHFITLEANTYIVAGSLCNALEVTFPFSPLRYRLLAPF
jgi:hypothetical protein